jgi:hypothetical protein
LRWLTPTCPVAPKQALGIIRQRRIQRSDREQQHVVSTPTLPPTSLQALMHWVRGIVVVALFSLSPVLEQVLQRVDRRSPSEELESRQVGKTDEAQVVISPSRSSRVSPANLH